MSEHEQAVSDDMLMAYADGELDAETQAAVTAAVASDPSLAATVAMFRATSQASLAAYADILAESPPEKLRNAVAGHGAEPHRLPATSVRRPATTTGRGGWKKTLPRKGFVARSLLGLPMAACLVLAAGIGGYALRDVGAGIPAADALLLNTGDSLTAALAGQPSGGKVPLATADGSAELTLTGSYAVDNGLCRAFTIRAETAEQGSVRALACRAKATGWRIEMAVREAGSDETGFSPASDRAASAIDGQLDALGAGASLERDEEAAALANLKED